MRKEMLMRYTSPMLVAGADRLKERLNQAMQLGRTSRQRFFQKVRLPLFRMILVACVLLLLGSGGDESGGKLLQPVASWPGYGRGPAMAVAVDGNHAYVAAGSGGLIVLDVSNPAQPVRVGSYWAAGVTRCVQVSGSRAYVARTVRAGGGCIANSRGRLDVLDVTDPAKPKLLGSHPMPRSITDLQIVGQLAYVVTLAERSSGLEVLDVSDPTRLVGLEGRSSSGSKSVRVDGRRVCAMGGGVLQVGDADPARTGWDSIVAFTNVVAGGAVWLQGDYAYVTYAQDGQVGVLEAIDLRPPVTSVGNFQTDEPLLGIQVVGTSAYAPAGDGGLLVFEVGDPKAPKAIGRLKTAGCAVGVTVAGRYAYVAGYEGGLHIVDVSEPARPVLMATYETGLTTRQVHVEGGRALLVSSDRHDSGLIGKCRLELVDISNPSVPTLLGFYESPGTLKESSFSANLSCLLLEDGPLEVVDWSNPSKPQRTGTIAFDGVGDLVGLSSWASHVYLAIYDRLKVFDLSAPATPRLVSELALPDYIQELRVRGNRAYVVWSNGIRIFDVSNPAKPLAVGTWLSPDGNIDGSSLGLGGNHAYLNTYQRSLLVLNIADPGNPFLAGTCSVHAPVVSVAAEGRYAYLAEGAAGIEVIDVADPAQPVAVPGWLVGGSANGVQAQGGFLYVADAGLGLVVLKARSDLAMVQPPKDQRVEAGESATLDVFATGPGPVSYQWYLGPTGDTSRPIVGATSRRYTLPEVVGDTSLWVRVTSGADRVDSPTTLVSVVPEMTLERVGAWPGYRMGPANAVGLFGNFACVAAGSAGLMLFDISNPNAPQRVGGYEADGGASDVAVSGQHAFVLESAGLTVLDLSDPPQPRKIGGWTTTDSVHRFSVKGNLAAVVESSYVQGGGAGKRQWTLALIDLSTPQAPQAVGRYAVALAPNDWFGNRVNGVVMADNHAFLTESWRDATGQIERGSLKIVNISNPAQPRLVGSYAADHVSGVAVQGNYAVLTKSWWGETYQGSMEIINISNPAIPQLIVSYPMPGGAVAVFLDWPRAYVSTAGRLVVLDVSNPAQPKQLGEHPGGAADVAFANGYAYLAASGEGLRVLDVSNPAQPTRLGSFDTDRIPTGLQIKAPYAYVTFGDEGLRVFDISNPAQPAPVGHYGTNNYYASVVCDGGYAYVSDGGNLTMLDLSSPANPQLAGSCQGLWGSKICIAGQYAYIAGEASGRGGLEVVDVSNPATLRRVGGYGEWAGALGVLGQYVYVAAGDGGLGVFNLGNPTAPRRVGTYYPAGLAEDILLRDKQAYLAVSKGDGGDSASFAEGGLEILDLTDPTRPRLVGTSLRSEGCRRVDLDGRFGAAVTSEQSLALLDLSRPAQPVILARTVAPEATEVAVNGDTVYLAQGSYGFTSWRITPVLRLNRPVVSGGMVELSWRGGPGPKLQRASSLEPTAWEDVAGSELVSQIDLPFEGAVSFFRLIKR
jgi:hypothetical protein